MKSNTPITFQAFTICCSFCENLLRDNLALGFKGCAIGDCGISWSPLGRYLAMISGRWIVYHLSTSRFLGTNILSKKKRRFMDHLKNDRFFYPASRPKSLQKDQQHGRGQGVVHGLAVALLHSLAHCLVTGTVKLPRQNSQKRRFFWEKPWGHGAIHEPAHSY